jgi:hypothetical protein
VQACARPWALASSASLEASAGGISKPLESVLALGVASHRRQLPGPPDRVLKPPQRALAAQPYRQCVSTPGCAHRTSPIRSDWLRSGGVWAAAVARCPIPPTIGRLGASKGQPQYYERQVAAGNGGLLRRPRRGPEGPSAERAPRPSGLPAGKTADGGAFMALARGGEPGRGSVLRMARGASRVAAWVVVEVGQSGWVAMAWVLDPVDSAWCGE